MIAAAPSLGRTAADRRMRRRRIVRNVLLVLTAVVWLPIAIVVTYARAGAR